MDTTIILDSKRTVSGLPRDNRVAPWLSAGLVLIANFLAIKASYIPLLGAVIGFWFLIVHPVYLLSTTTTFWKGTKGVERVGYSLTGVLLYLMVGGLVMNFLLPLAGITHPLSPIPVVVLVDVLTGALWYLREKYSEAPRWRPAISAVTPVESRFLVASLVCTALAIFGANRLNNEAGDELAVLTLVVLISVFVLLLVWRQKIREGVICGVVYLLSLALLLATSLRGWFVTGHDIQTEYRVFQLTVSHDRWSIDYFHNAYNACLSITILPTEFLQVLHVDAPYVYKLFFQLMFALCPVLVYAISRRYWNKTIAILATVYFVGFPTYFSDMPFLNRQEVAYLFVCMAVISVTNTQWGLRRRQVFLFGSGLGVELSHYSTMYVFLVALSGGWITRAVIKLCRDGWIRRQGSPKSAGQSWATISSTVSLGAIVVVAAIAFMWGGLATGTAGDAVTDASASVTQFFGSTQGSQAGGVSYGLVHGAPTTPASIINAYRKTTIAQSVAAGPSVFEPASLAEKAPTPIVSDSTLPVTRFGRVISDLGVPVSLLNSAIRQVAAKGEQVFVLIGLIAFLAVAGYRKLIGREFFSLCVGSLLVVALITVVPGLSIDYGILRAFQESLIVISPILVVGSLVFFRFLGRRWGLIAAEVVCLGLLASTSGLLPQVLGGYPAQLSLNNSGGYYDQYYTHPQEVSALGWLSAQPDTLPYNVQAESFTDRFTFTTPGIVSGQQILGDNYPTAVKRSSWVVLGYPTVVNGIATTAADAGPLVTYVYPKGFLQATKNLVYNNGGTEIYK